MSPWFSVKRSCLRRAAVEAMLVGALALAGPAATAMAAPMAPDQAGKSQPAPNRKPSPGPVGKTPSGPPPCENGEDRDQSGACPVVDDAPSTRGFTLFSGAMATARGHGPATLTQVRDPARPTAGVETPVRGRFGDLKVDFKPGSAVLTAEGKARLADFAKALLDPSLSAKRFEIAGHTDASGSPTRNLTLSQARAQSIVVFLAAHGVAASRLQAKGYGAEGLALPDRPLDPANRRVEARVLD